MRSCVSLSTIPIQSRSLILPTRAKDKLSLVQNDKLYNLQTQGDTTMADENLLLDIGGETISLADLAGVDMDAVSEVRQTLFPAGAFKFRAEPAKLDVYGSGADRTPVIAFKFKCIDVLSLTDAALSADTVIGKFHQEPILLTEPMEGLGRTKAFMADTGFKGSGQLEELLSGFSGTEFYARITHRPDKKDTSRIYANIGLNIGAWKIAPGDGKLPD